ncbi:MAG: hypothetical protein IPJ47_05065 [Anaerolineales bacterium]|nr:hypothetical protein [Anaerolineales bacterium]
MIENNNALTETGIMKRLDFEENYDGTYKGWKNWRVFLERVKELVPGKEIMIYTGYYYWRDNAPTQIDG